MPRYTKEDIELLRANYLHKTYAELGKLLGGRSRFSIHEKLKKIGLPMKRSVGQKNTSYRAYQTWASMLARCQNPKRAEYSYYGGRGISVCEKWLNFKDFLSDMGERPLGYSIDRIDPHGNYEPTNCRWLISSDQQKTTRKYLAVKMCVDCGERRGNQGKGRCRRCAQYFLSTGNPRPRTKGRIVNLLTS